MTWRIVYQGVTIGLISLVAYLLGRHDGGQELGQTMAFAVLAFSQLVSCSQFAFKQIVFFQNKYIQK